MRTQHSNHDYQKRYHRYHRFSLSFATSSPNTTNRVLGEWQTNVLVIIKRSEIVHAKRFGITSFGWPSSAESCSSAEERFPRNRRQKIFFRTSHFVWTNVSV